MNPAALSDREFSVEIHHDEMLADTDSVGGPHENDIVQDTTQYDAKGIEVRANY